MLKKKKYLLFTWSSSLNKRPAFLSAECGNAGAEVSVTAGPMVLGVGADFALWLPNLSYGPSPWAWLLSCRQCVNAQHTAAFCLTLRIRICD